MIKHNRRSIRIKGYDYSQYGWYFVTICVNNWKCLFGKVKNKEIKLSKIGNVADKFWKKIPSHFSFVDLDEFVVMPNHIHGIINIKTVGTPHVVSLQNKFSRHISGSLSVIVQQYKSSVKRWCNKNGFDEFQWQPRFYEHIIRNEESLNKIREYIIYNPLNWETDLENTEYINKLSLAEKQKQIKKYDDELYKL